MAALASLVAADPDPRVRSAALGALARLTGGSSAAPPDPAAAPPDPAAAWRWAAADPDPSVRRRAADMAPAFGDVAAPLVGLLGDRDAGVAEAAAWALGELAGAAIAAGAVEALAGAAGGHSDPLVREAAVAALGSLGDAAGLPAVLHACQDKAAVRRRAVLALAAFDGPEVDAALEAALEDRDWQTRQAAEDLLGPSGRS
ncbi:MAG TPA: HEAT repeat domain-containing protein [Acidimicrobiia bacterium]|nr:HEAT repeat domain-containing protein [Acidimicrobiia bacterium]